jgi:hypothetical protein
MSFFVVLTGFEFKSRVLNQLDDICPSQTQRLASLIPAPLGIRRSLITPQVLVPSTDRARYSTSPSSSHIRTRHRARIG